MTKVSSAIHTSCEAKPGSNETEAANAICNNKCSKAIDELKSDCGNSTMFKEAEKMLSNSCNACAVSGRELQAACFGSPLEDMCSRKCEIVFQQAEKNCEGAKGLTYLNATTLQSLKGNRDLQCSECMQYVSKIDSACEVQNPSCPGVSTWAPWNADCFAVVTGAIDKCKQLANASPSGVDISGMMTNLTRIYPENVKDLFPLPRAF